MRNLELIVKEFNVKNECLLQLAKKLIAIGTSKATVSAMRICCKLNMYIPAKFNTDVAKLISDSATHKTILVRSETAIALRELLVEGGLYEFTAINALKKLLKDPQSSVQVFAFESLCWRIHSKQYFQTSILGLVISCLEIKNWRIRFIFVRQLIAILTSIEAKNRKPIVAFFAKCLNDTEQDVSMLAMQNLKGVTGLIDIEDLVDKIMPELTKTMNNDNLEVKLAMCESLCHLSPYLVKNNEAMSQLKGMVMGLAKDTNSEIRVRLLLNVEPYLKSVMSQSTNVTILGIITDLLADKNWKIRINGIKSLELLVIKFPDDFASDEKILKIFHEKLTDRISNIRKGAILSLRNIAQAQGGSWCEKYCVPILHAFGEHPNYLYRINFLFGIAEVFQLISASVLLKEVELVFKLGRDPVPNIRFQALLVLLRIAQIGEDKLVEDKVRKSADGLTNDPDGEVRRLAKSIGGTKELKAISEKGFELVI